MDNLRLSAAPVVKTGMLIRGPAAVEWTFTAREIIDMTNHTSRSTFQ